ncbi:MAG TPA: methionine--tRNA ligase [Kofleriaceae bacterium]|nr:methionine--tRNA ligase [Kofleriaceae bacterium]
MTTSFITTAIPYVNATPHLGFAYELVLADILARHRRRRGDAVKLVAGTDDHSLKNVRAAAREGLATAALVERNAAAFAQLGDLLGLSIDDFVRTSRDPRHRVAVEHLWRACAGDLYRRAWEGHYCVGCEAFVDSAAPCAEHGTAPERVVEDNWFFRLSRYRAPIRDAIASGRLTIVPDAARAETLAFLDGEVRDLSVSRDATRAGSGWGIPVPGDPSQVIYVWFDALANYLSALSLGGDAPLVERWWRDAEVTHVIGKGITRFHAVYWPAFLLAANLPLPDRIFVHGYLTVDGEKIAKSGRGFAVEPVVADVGRDALRWFFARRCRTRADSDVTRDAIVAAHDGDLVDRLGNLVHRTRTLAASVGRVDVAPPPEAVALPGRIDAALDAFCIDEAAAAIVDVADTANRLLDQTAPWRLARTDRAAAARALATPIALARAAAEALAPICPEISRALLAETEGPPLHRLRDSRAPVASPSARCSS